MPATISGSQNGTVGLINYFSAVATTSGTVITFTGIPSAVERITLIMSGVSLSSTANYLVQLGTSGGFSTSGYQSSGFGYGATFSSTAGLIVPSSSATRLTSAVVTLFNVTGTTWVGQCVFAADSSSSGGGVTTMNVSLAGVLNSVRINTTTGTDTFDAGTANVFYE